MTSQNQHFQSTLNEGALCIRRIKDVAPQALSYREQQLQSSQLILENDLNIRGTISRSPFGKPQLDTDYHLSISHTGEWIAMIATKNIPVAIDIELAARDVSKIKSRYTTPDEINRVASIFPVNPELLIWSCKECLFKVLNTQAVHFKEQLYYARQIKDGTVLWHVDHPSFEGDYLVNYFIFETLLVTYIDELPTRNE